ncbi:MAG: glucose 1-dehydrogenase [Acidobacteria bacterium]|nr:glucose 1-dehydrogenase [Acidobacteriota bacterium]
MTLERFTLDGRCAIITGASRGIGAACAETLAEAGADLVIGARSSDSLAEVAETCRALGVRATAVTGDLSSREGLAALVEAASDEFGRIDIVVNNVGGAMPQAFMDTSERAFEEALSWNVTSAFNLTQLATPLLVDGGGAVVNITSAAGRFRDRGFAAYGTAKAALIALTRNLASDLSPNVRVNAVSPGAIATPALDIVLQSPELEAAMIQRTPLGRLGTASDIAAAVLFLASDASSYITGRVIDVDGGIEASNLDMGIADLD